MTPDLQSPSRGIAIEEYIASANIQPPSGDPRIAFRLSQGPPALPYTVNPDGTVPFLGTNLQRAECDLVRPEHAHAVCHELVGGHPVADGGHVAVGNDISGQRWRAPAGSLGHQRDSPERLRRYRDVWTRIFADPQSYKPYTQFGTVRHYSNYGHSTYHGVTFRAEKRYGRNNAQYFLYLLENAG